LKVRFSSSYHDKETIKCLARNFKNLHIGVVTGRDMILNVEEEVVRSEDLYLKILNFVRTAESRTDSTIYMKGEAARLEKI